MQELENRLRSRIKELETPPTFKQKLPEGTPEYTEQVSALSKYLQSSEGKLALRFLKLSGKHINLAETDPCNGHCVVTALDGEGLITSYEATGMWVAYVNDKREIAPRITKIKAKDAVRDFMNSGPGAKGDDIVSFIRSELRRKLIATS